MGVFDLNQPQDPFAQWSSPMAGVAPVQKKKPLYASLFDHMNGGQDPNAPYQMPDAAKDQSFRHGLLQLAAAMATPNGGNFARSLSTGLLAGTEGMQGSQQQYGDNAYRNTEMQHQQDQYTASKNMMAMKQGLLGPDGKLDQAKFAQYAVMDPEGAASLRKAISPTPELQTLEINGKKVSAYVDPNTKQITGLDGVPLNTGGGMPPQGPQTAPQGAPTQMGGGGPQMPAASPQTANGAAPPANIQQIIAEAAGKYHVPLPFALGLAQQESGFNPSATGPQTKYGHAQGLYQYIPPTAKALGIDPMDPRQSADAAMKQAAAAAAAHGGDWGAAAAQHFAGPNPAQQGPKTRQYVADVMARQQKFGAMGGVDSSPPDQVASVSIPAQAAHPAIWGLPSAGEDDIKPKLSQDFRWADSAHTRAEPIPGSPADQSATGLDPDTIHNMAYDQIFTGHRPPAGRNGGGAVFKSVENEVARVATEAGVSPGALATQAGRTKVIMGTMAKLQTRASMIEAQSATVSKNVDYARTLQAKINPSQYPIINKYLMAGKSNYMGDPNVAAFITAVNSVQTEYAKTMSGSTGSAPATDSSMSHSRVLFNEGMNPSQIMKVADAMNTEMQNQKDSYNSDLAGLSSRAQEFGLGAPKPAAAAPVAPVAQMSKDEALQHLKDARNAVMSGANKDAVRQRMVEMGLPQLAGRL